MNGLLSSVHTNFGDCRNEKRKKNVLRSKNER
jgi:hypothetical protein